jgi:hypothetical protein
MDVPKRRKSGEIRKRAATNDAKEDEEELDAGTKQAVIAKLAWVEQEIGNKSLTMY